ncbi:MAG: Tim44 domain-containing protein [Rhodoferax sp.]|nr:Tim44 domain-containing protein [Rhodoferax sp.]
MRIWVWVLVGMLSVCGTEAEAGPRLGGGKSFGKQSNNVAQREAAPVAPQAPAQNMTNAAPKPGSPTPAAPAVAPKRPWGAMLGGLAAGLGLAWLASSLGLGAAFGNILLFALVALVAVMLIGWFMRSRRSASAPTPLQPAPFAFQGASPLPFTNSRPYRPENVGNDASARPWERSSMAFEVPQATTSSGSMIGSALMGSQTWGVPAGFDSEGFLSAAKTNFVTLQSAWDRSDIAALRAMMTDTMLAEIKSQLAERETHTGGNANQTEVVMIEARLLGIEELPDEYMASVEFSGMIREDASAGPGPFREVWNMTKAKDGSHGWLVAGVQALQ